MNASSCIRVWTRMGLRAGHFTDRSLPIKPNGVEDAGRRRVQSAPPVRPNPRPPPPRRCRRHPRPNARRGCRNHAVSGHVALVPTTASDALADPPAVCCRRFVVIVSSGVVSSHGVSRGAGKAGAPRDQRRFRDKSTDRGSPAGDPGDCSKNAARFSACGMPRGFSGDTCNRGHAGCPRGSVIAGGR